MFTAPVVGVVLDARFFVDAHLTLIDDPPQWRPPIDDIFVHLGRDVFDRDVRVVLEFGKIAFGRRFELLKYIDISPRPRWMSTSKRVPDCLALRELERMCWMIS